MKFTIITSTNHPAVKAATALHHAKYRAEQGRFIAEGTRSISTLLDAGIAIDTLFHWADTPIEPLYSRVQEQQIITVSEAVMKKISPSVSPSGIVATFFIPTKQTVATIDQTKGGLILAELADPGNMGTLIRSAAAMNVKTVICVGGVDPWHPRVVHASAGTIGMVTIVEATWQQIHLTLKTSRCALVPTGGLTPEELDQKSVRFLIIGNEAHGIPKAWLEHCKELCSLPMPGKTESLNAAVAGSIVLYLLYRHHH